MTHTQGEWTIKEDCSTDCMDIAAEGQNIATIWRWNKGQRLKVDSEANAKLIAAAPDLLRALINLLESYRADFRIITGSPLNNTEAVKQADAAIQKAIQ